MPRERTCTRIWLKERVTRSDTNYTHDHYPATETVFTIIKVPVNYHHDALRRTYSQINLECPLLYHREIAALLEFQSLGAYCVSLQKFLHAIKNVQSKTKCAVL